MLLRIIYLALRPARNAVLAADFLENSRTDAEFLIEAEQNE